VKVCLKSRQIGLSWAEAATSVTKGMRRKGQSTYYIGYNLDMARQFITDCSWWIKRWQLIGIKYDQSVVRDADKDIITFRIRLSSGKEIVALSSRPTNLRGKRGRVIIDEAAHHGELQELIDAGLALLMWGGQVSIISTHFGVENRFYELINEIKEGKKDYSYHEIPFLSAVKEGLFKRIQEASGKPYSVEKEQEWIKTTYEYYGTGAGQELDCIPSQGGAGVVFNRIWFPIVDSAPEGGVTVRFWDLAATAAAVNAKACYTAGVKMRFVDNKWWVLDVIMEQVNPTEGDKLLYYTAARDGQWTKVRWELEGGSAGKRDEAHIKELLSGYDVGAVKPLGDKVTRARPFARESMSGNVFLVRANWNDRYLDCLNSFPMGVIDPVDASTGAFAELTTATPKARIGSYHY